MISADAESDKLPSSPELPLEQRQPVSAEKEKPLIGWREWVVFPEFGNILVKAKIDTGAHTSAIHAWNAEIVQRDGIDIVSFELHPLQRNNDKIVKCQAPLSDRRSVKNSGGQSTNRLFVKTHVLLGEKKWPIELSLTRRDEMGFRMLLGRAAISGRYLVDPGKSFLLDK